MSAKKYEADEQCEQRLSAAMGVRRDKAALFQWVKVPPG